MLPGTMIMKRPERGLRATFRLLLIGGLALAVLAPPAGATTVTQRTVRARAGKPDVSRRYPPAPPFLTDSPSFQRTVGSHWTCKVTGTLSFTVPVWSFGTRARCITPVTTPRCKVTGISSYTGRRHSHLELGNRPAGAWRLHLDCPRRRQRCHLLPGGQVALEHLHRGWRGPSVR